MVKEVRKATMRVKPLVMLLLVLPEDSSYGVSVVLDYADTVSA